METSTKKNLILSALELFALQGVDAVSMRTINNAAGTKNASAVHYHFGNKLGIIEAIVTFIRTELDTYRLDALCALEQRVAAGEQPTVREILWAAFAPYARLYKTPGYGAHAVKFFARVLTDKSPELREVLFRDPQSIAKRLDALLARALPDLPDDTRRMRYIYFWTLMVQGFSSSDQHDKTVFGDLTPSSDEEGALRFFDYLVGGMEGPVSAVQSDLHK
jgi:AcrR family transcriptional regulator